MAEHNHPIIDEKLDQWDAGERVLVGITTSFKDGSICEMAGRIGFDMVWIDLEHGTAGFETVETLCAATVAGGGIPVGRISGHHRHHILRTLETGARMVLVPMVNNADIAREIIVHGKFPPLGRRGFNQSSRGLNFGLGDTLETFDWANRTTHLIAQIETSEAVDNLDAILEVDGLSGVFIGPGDLSVSLGCPAQFDHPRLRETIVTIVKRAREAGKHVGLLGPPPLLKTGLDAGADFIFCGGDLPTLRTSWIPLLERARKGFSDV